MNTYKQGQKKAQQLINRAIRIRDAKGYHENLGYEYDRTLKDYLATLELSYSDECNIMQEFYQACDKI